MGCANSWLLRAGHHLTLSQTSPGFYMSALTLSQTMILDSSILKEFADDIVKFDVDSRKFFRQVENIVVKGEIARYEQFLLFPQCFLKTCIADP